MPLPLIPLIIGGGTVLFGLGKGIKAAKDTGEAKDVNKRANRILDNAKEHLELCRKESGLSLEVLGGKKISVLDKEMTRFVQSFEKLKNVDFQSSVGIDELRLDKQALEDLKKMGGYAASILGGTVGGTLGGALTAFGAYGLASTIGVASTGTAIAGLGGAAATNATLAFLGGGSLAAGGLGMAGGMAVLGGLVAGPALAIMGLIVGAKAKANLDNAYSNLAEGRKIAEELNTAAVLVNGIRRRAYMFERLLVRLEALFFPLVIRMENTIASRGVDFLDFTKEEQGSIACAGSLAGAIKKVLDTPILTQEGKLTDESARVAETMKGVIDKFR